MKKKILCGLLAIMLCISLTGCGDKTNSENNQNNSNNNSSEKENSKDNEVVDYEIKDEDGKVIIDLGGSTTQVYYHDGEMITDFEIYLDWKDNKTAKEMAAIAKQAADDSIDWIEAKGKYVVYNYKEGNYNDMTTYEELRDYAKVFNVVLDANNKKNEADTMEWPTSDYPRPDNCVLVKLAQDASGVKLIVKWNSAEDVTAYKKLLAKEYDVTFYTSEGDGINNNNYIGKEISLFYSKSDENQNYILFNE